VELEVAWLLTGDHDLPSGTGWLAPPEADRAAAMRFRKRRSEYLLRRWAGKQAVAAVAGLKRDVAGLRRLEVANASDGAPYAVLGDEVLDLRISLTDRAGWAVCAVTRPPREVGCGLELVEPRSPGFVADFFTAREQAYAAAVDDRAVAVTLLWSAKESALKLMRSGLRRDTRSVEVTLGGDLTTRSRWQPLEVGVAGSAGLPGWWRVDGVFALTVVAQPAPAEPVALPGSADLAAAVPVHSWRSRPEAVD